MRNCRFCTEIESFKDSIFNQVYAFKSLENRIVLQSNNFIVIPSLAQLIPYSYMIIPKEHIETTAEVNSEYYSELLDLASKVESKLNRNCILFEHGAGLFTGSGCGIYHAHVHIIPIKSNFRVSELLGVKYFNFDDFTEMMEMLRTSNNYVFYRDSKGKYYCKIHENSDESDLFIFQSQFLRKWIISKFNLNKEWDWKMTNDVEKEVLNSLKLFKI